MKFLLRYLIMAAPLNVAAQAPAHSIDSTLLKKFPSAVVLKVFDISREVPLNTAQQIRLAVWFSGRDSLMATRILAGARGGEIDSLDQTGLRGMVSIIGNRAMFAYLQGKSVTPSRSGGSNEGYSFYPALYASRYLGDALARLRAIRPLSSEQEAQIGTSFYAAIRGDRYIDWASAMEDATRRNLEDTMVFSRLHHDVFVRQAYELSATDRYDLVKMQQVSAGAYDSIAGLIQQKNYARAVLQYVYAVYHHAKFDSLERSTTHYYDSLVEAALLRDGSLQPRSQFAMALKYRAELGLSQAQCDSMLWHAQYLSQIRDSIHRMDRYANPDPGAYESLHLSTLLTDEQYTLLLSYKNSALAVFDATTDWEEMVTRGIDRGLDKDSTIRAISGYYLVKYNIWNRMAQDPIARWAAIRAIGESRPAALKALEPLRWNGDTAKAANSLKLQW